MIEYVSIKNFALIEDVTLRFSGNFNVLTGETGTGKSIIIDALTILLGGRAQSDFIRSGTDKAILEGAVYLSSNYTTVMELLDELGLKSEDNTLILSREITLNGRNICRINGRMLTLSQYRQIGLAIIDIHGQHEHQSLLQEDKHLEFLDQFGGAEQQQLKNEVKAKYISYLAAQKELEELKASEQERLQKIDFLSFQIEEIKQARLQPGEIEELTREVNVLTHAGKISENLNQAYYQLFGEERGNSAYDLLSKAVGNLQEIMMLDPSLEKLGTQLEPALYLLEEGALQIRTYLEELEYSPEKLAQSEKRLHLLQDLCKKYGATLEDVLAYAEKATVELDKWLSGSKRLQSVTEELTKKFEEYRLKAELLSSQRKKQGQLLETKVTAQLAELAMPYVRFSINLFPCTPTVQGLDQVNFLISPNPGEPLMPVAKIASGGELSRIMLALKTILAEIDGIGTLVFDEIDSGIGGKTAQKVADKLEKISKSQQVICVTHSPLIAALADQHLILEKEVKQGRTRTIVRELKEKERVEELARMLGGENPSSDLKKHASLILKSKIKEG